MKYRIIEKKYSDGSSTFYPQYKGWFFWHYFSYLMYEAIINVCCPTMEEAEKEIANHRERHNQPVQVARNIYEVQ